jgi:hypothetical protein
MPGEDKLLQLQGVYNTLYNSITRPDFKFVLTRYFIDEWLPVLGPSLAWLVVGLRQQCYWNQRRDWCIIDKASLARETALDERTIERCLKKPYSSWFVGEVSHRYQYRTQIGKRVRDKNRYQLFLDDPLSPRHQLGLATLLRQLAPAGSNTLEAALQAVQTVLELPFLNDKIAYTGVIPTPFPRRTILELVAETVNLNLASYAGDERLATLDQRCAKLYNLIVQPNKVYVGWQYFRLHWVPLLGHALSWLIVYMRRQCYWDEASGELRDTLLAYKKDLAAAIGQTPRNLANLLENDYLDLFFTSPTARQTGESEAVTARNKPIWYQIRMIDEPLTPADQKQVALTLRQQLEGTFYARDPENGQLNMFPALGVLSNRQNFAYGQIVEKMSVSERKISRIDEAEAEKMPQYEAPAIGKFAVTLKDSLLPLESKQEQQQIQAAVAKSEALLTILDDIGVQEPTRSRLLANPELTVTKVGAWFLYAETQPNLWDPPGYVIKRLLENDQPPEKFVTFAKLDDATWSLFEEAAQQLRVGQPLSTLLAPELLNTFVEWVEVYVGLEPAQTRYLLSELGRPVASSNRSSPAPETTAAVDPKRDTGCNFWRATLAQLQLQIPRHAFETWLKQTEVLDYRENVLVVDAKTAFAKDWLENRLIKVIETTLSSVIGVPTRVRFALADQG